MASQMHPARQAYVEEAREDDAGIDLENLPTDTNYELPSLTAGVPSQQASAILDEFARKRKAAQIAVPTDDQRVRAELRARGEPITLFGEKREDRRDRLREILFAQQEGGANEDESMQDADEGTDEDEPPQEFYTKGSTELIGSRQAILSYSLPRAQQRRAHQVLEATIGVSAHVRHRNAVKERLSGFELFGSQIACSRAVSVVRFSPDGEMLATGDWTGSVQILNVPDLQTKLVLRGHTAMIGGVSWHPEATRLSPTSSESVALASSGGQGDNSINLWSLSQDTPLSTLSGHSGRVCRIEFHPSGRYIASASYDTTWRLWDVATTTELLSQEGHSKEVYALCFQSDGSLIATAGLDSIGRIWDLRTGKPVMVLEGHAQPIYTMDWNPDGFRVASGSADGSVKVWDLRSVREAASIGAHMGGVTDLRWFKGTDGPSSGELPQAADIVMNGDSHGDNAEREFVPKKSGTFFVSCGFDQAVNIFSGDDWALCKSLTGHDGPALSTDVSSDARWIASCGRDRTVKLWAREDMEGI